MEFISVIVPIYKVEQYLNRCVESIINQTYKNLQIILVDDGSPDKCGIMCDEWAVKDNRIKVIHKKNGGLSDARNAGLDVSKGEYVSFVDSDDWIDEGFLEALYNKMQETNADIVTGGIKMVWDNGTEKFMTPPHEMTLDNKNAMLAIIKESDLKQPVWYKLYKYEIAKEYFKKGVLHEDDFWSYKVIAKANKVVVMDQPYYYYRQRPLSIMSQSYSLKRLAEVESRIERQEFLLKNYPELADEGYINLLFAAFYQGVEVIDNLKGAERNIILKKIGRELNRFSFSKEGYHQIKNTYKIWILMSKISFRYTCYLRKILKLK